jgi:hypothetical protein
MKKLSILVLLISSLSLESFYPRTACESNNENRIGVWKTYEDFVNGNLTDLGAVSENPNVSKDGLLFFEKEHIDPATTQYWGMRYPCFDFKPSGFANRRVPIPNTSKAVHFFNGKEWNIEIAPMPIGVYSRPDAFEMLAVKGSGDPVITNGVRTTAAEATALSEFFAGDEEMQASFDADYARAKGGSAHYKVFVDHAKAYNAKHTPGYEASLKDYQKKSK